VPEDRAAEVLVVDDDAGVRALVRETLEQAGYSTVEAASREEALEAARERLPVLVVTDVQMPDGSGYEVCLRLREEHGDELPIIILSGTRREAYDRVAGFEFGADDYMVKPFEPEELRARVRALLRRSGHSRARASSPSPSAVLTPRELEVLRLLAEGLNQAEIAKQFVVSPKTVGKHIERILKKLSVRSRAEAVAKAYGEGLVEPRPAA
jgi:DNA-binding NarL/FixJ family response regulator